MSEHPEDIAAELERLMVERPVGDTPSEPAPAPPAAAATAASSPDRSERTPTVDSSELQAEMDELRELLDAAFHEVFERIERLDRDAAAADARIGDELTALRATSQQVAEHLDDIGNALLATTASIDDRAEIALIANRLDAVAHLVQSMAERPDPAAAPVDLAPIDARLDALIQAFGKHLAGDRARIEAGLAALAEELRARRDQPVRVDTRTLEEAANRGALHNAADIANLRRDIELLAESVRVQDKGIDELRTTLDWIKERLLLR